MDKQSNSTIAPAVSIGEAINQALDTILERRAAGSEHESPIMTIARRLGRARADYDLFDGQSTKATHEDDDGAAHVFQKAKDQRYDEEEVLREALSLELASSISDAAIQAAALTVAFALIMDQVPEEARDYHFKREVRAAERLMHSILHFLDGASPERVEAIVDDGFGGLKLSPWLRPEARLSLMRIAREKRALSTAVDGQEGGAA